MLDKKLGLPAIIVVFLACGAILGIGGFVSYRYVAKRLTPSANITPISMAGLALRSTPTSLPEPAGCIEEREIIEKVEKFDSGACSQAVFPQNHKVLIKLESSCGSGVAFGAFTGKLTETPLIGDIILDPNYELIVIKAVPSTKSEDNKLTEGRDTFNCDETIANVGVEMCKNTKFTINGLNMNLSKRELRSIKSDDFINELVVNYYGVKIKVMGRGNTEDLVKCVVDEIGIPNANVIKQHMSEPL